MAVAVEERQGQHSSFPRHSSTAASDAVHPAAPILLCLPRSLTQFPAVYDFQLVVKQALPAGDSARLAPAQLLAHYRQLIADTTAADIPLEQCTAKERLGGKFVSLSIPARVQAAHVLDLVWSALADDPAVLMKY